MTPQKPLFLYGYPHVERISEGVHDPLYASAMVLSNGACTLALCALDVVFVTKPLAARIREAVHRETGIPPDHILVSCTHTHSGPVTARMLSNREDPVVPGPDPDYVNLLVESAAQAIVRAHQTQRPAELALATADARGLGGNRRVPGGQADPQVPVLVVRDGSTHAIMTLSTVFCMHPTVLHEDSRLVSADFPGYARQYLKRRFGQDVAVLYHTGPEGDQSPRHWVKANTFGEARRLGEALGARIENAVAALGEADFHMFISLSSARSEVVLAPRTFPPPEEAERKLNLARRRFEELKESGQAPAEVRTAECDLFGAEESAALARAAADGTLGKAMEDVLPVEIQVLAIDGSVFVCLPGEWFVDYSLQIKHRSPVRTFVICLANGELQGYIVTPAAEAEGGYEAGNSLFPSRAGGIIVEEALRAIET